jgi:hypothetical protein
MATVVRMDQVWRMVSVPRAKRVDEAVVSAAHTVDGDASFLSFKTDGGTVVLRNTRKAKTRDSIDLGGPLRPRCKRIA